MMVSDEYDKYLEYKNEYLVFVTNKNNFAKKHKKLIMRKPSLEEVMLMQVKGVK